MIELLESQMDYCKIYEQLCQRAKNRIPPEGYIEHHHVVPRCMGGTDDSSNIAVLTPEEHFMAHLLLVKMYPDEKGLIFALNMMTQGRKSRLKVKHRKLYGWLKRRFSERMSEKMKESQKGEGNSQFGKPRSEETKRKISEALKGRPNPRKGLPTGRKLSENEKKKLSAVHKGKKLTAETKEKMLLTKFRNTPEKPYPRIYGPYQGKRGHPKYVVVESKGKKKTLSVKKFLESEYSSMP